MKDYSNFNRELQEITPDTKINWKKSKEEIWSEMLNKIEASETSPAKTKRMYFPIIQYAAAAIVVLFLSTASLVYFNTKTIETQFAQEIDFVLPDQSKVHVYENSVLSYKPLMWKLSREVKFEGNGLFSVEKGKKFAVISKKGKTIVLGTQFDINTRDNKYAVSCTRGKVKVVESANKHQVIITAGQQAFLKTDGNFEVSQINSPNTKTETKKQFIENELNKILETTPKGNVENKNNKEVQTNIQLPEAENKQDIKSEEKEQEPVNQLENQLQESLKNNSASTVTEQNKTENTEQEKNTEANKTSQVGKDKFRASLSAEQIKLLENKDLSKDEKRQKLMESLTKEQKELLQEQMEEKNNALNSEQKGQMREEMKEAGKGNTENQRQLQENMRNELEKGANGDESKKQQGPVK